jgi:hypothetical protein
MTRIQRKRFYQARAFGKALGGCAETGIASIPVSAACPPVVLDAVLQAALHRSREGETSE